MHSSTKKWLFTKISSLILLPLMAWFIINFVSIYDENYSEIAFFFTHQPSKISLIVSAEKKKAKTMKIENIIFEGC